MPSPDPAPASALTGPRGLVGLTRVILVLVGLIALAIAITTLIGGTVALIDDLAHGEWRIRLMVDHPIPAGAAHGSATILRGNWDTASLVLTGVTGPTAVFALISAVAGILTPVVFGGFVALLTWRLIRRRPFRRSLSISVALAGLIVCIGALLDQGAASLASGTAALDLDGGDLRGLWPVGGRFDPTWVVIGLVLMLIGLAFEYGERLQRDTDGLV